MINVTDLHIPTEILPLFDHTVSERSGIALEKIFSELPDTLEDGIDRQDIIKGLIANWDTVREFHYSIVDIHEVSKATIGFCTIEPDGLRLKMLTSKTEVRRLRSRVMQFVLFFDSLNKVYFSRIDVTKFPKGYVQRLDELARYLAEFQLSFFAGLIRADQFTYKHTRTILKIFAQHGFQDRTESAWNVFHEFEAYYSIAKTAIQHDYQFPKFDQRAFELKDLYHPLVKDSVKNDFISDSNVHLITGANISGKSTFLKAISLSVFLGRMGLPVPASSCSIPFFDSVSVCISGHDDLTNGYSHFRLQLKNLNDILLASDNGQRCFAVFDELFNATNPEDALEITKLSIAGLLARNNCCSFISTHLPELKQFAISNQALSCYHVECVLENGSPVFSYKIKSGWSEIKIGRLLFELEGLSQLIADRN